MSKRDKLILKIRFYSTKNEALVKDIIGPDRLYFYGEIINVPEKTKSIYIKICEEVAVFE